MSLPVLGGHSGQTHRLPVEIYQKIIKHLARNELSKFSRTARLCYTVAIPGLYKVLYVNPGSRYIPLAAIRDDVVHTLRGLPPIDAPLPNPFLYTTHLTIALHSVGLCAQYRAFRMPNLEVLRVIPHPYQSPELTFCIPPPGVYSSRGCCPLVRKLAPPRVILGNSATGFVGWVEGLWTASYRLPPETVRELVVYLGTDDHIHDETFLEELPDTVRKMTLVLETEEAKWKTYSARSFLDRIGMVCATDARVVELVGFENIDTMWLGMSIEEAMKQVRAAMKRVHLEEEDIQSDAQLERKFERVRWLSREEYDLRETTR